VATPRCHTRVRPPGDSYALRSAYHAISWVEVTRAGGWERHRHAEHELIIAVRKPYRCRLNNVALTVQPGEALLVQPGDWHEDLLTTGTAYFALWCRLREPLFAAAITPAQHIVRNQPTLGAGATALAELADAGAPPARLDALCDALLWQVLAGLERSALAAHLLRTPAGFASDLHGAFIRLGTRRLSVPTLARALQLSQRTLERRCRSELGCGPARAHVHWRLTQAAELLLTSDWPLRAISETLGFANPFHFSRAFARLHGQPPAAWRRSGGKR
jgi:AraC-like DNA-binding protein